MIEVGQKIQVLYDGDCGVCSWGCEVLTSFDKRNLLHLTPYQNYPESELQRFGTDYEKSNEKITVITLKGKSLFGAIGLNHVFWQYFPYNLLVALIYLFPPFLLIELLGYKLIAQNRAKISAFFGLRACALPTPKSLD